MSTPISPHLTVADFHFGAEVFSSDGTHIGNLRRVIIDEESLDVHAIVAQETRRFSGHFFGARGLLEDDVAIDIGAVAAATTDRVDLAVPVGAVRNTAPYLRYQSMDAPHDDDRSIAVRLVAGVPHFPRLAEEHIKDATEIEIVKGEPVVGESGQVLGDVREVLLDHNELVGVVMRAGHFPEDVILQVRFLARAEDGALFVRISDADLARLTPFHPKDPA